jgi:hypothetical protein
MTNILMLGSAWADMVYQEYMSNQIGGIESACPYLPFHLSSPKFSLSFEEYIKLGADAKLVEILKMKSNQASVLVRKLSFYTEKCHVAFIDADAIDSATGHEIIRNCAALGTPAYGVGINNSNSLIAPFYIRGIIYPRDTRDLYKVADLYAPKEKSNADLAKT